MTSGPDSGGHHLAQLNVARMRFPLDDARMAEFVELLEPVNRAADAAPGFVWRLETEAGDATAVRAFSDDRVLVNLSVWEDVDSLEAFVRGTEHLVPMRRRREWFARWRGPHLVLWWVPAGTVPTVAEAVAKLELLAANGPSPEAFTLRSYYPPV